MSDHVRSWLVWQLYVSVAIVAVYGFARDLVRKVLGRRTPA